MPTHTIEDVEVEEVHAAEHDEHDADFTGEGFDAGADGGDLVSHLQRETDEAEVDEVEADDEEVIDGIGERSVSRKHVDKEEDAIPVERPPDPDCEQDADGQVDEVGGDEGVHRAS